MSTQTSLINGNKKAVNLQEEKLLKSGKAAKFLNLPHRTFKDLVKRGIIIPTQTTLSGYNLFSKQTLVEFAQSGQKLQKWAKNGKIQSQTGQKIENSAAKRAENLQNGNSEFQVEILDAVDESTEEVAEGMRKKLPEGFVDDGIVVFDRNPELLFRNAPHLLPNKSNKTTVININGEISEANDEQISEVKQGISNYKHDSKRHDANEKLIKFLFDLTDEQYSAGTLLIKEGVKNHSDVITSLSFDKMNYVLFSQTRLDPFDREVCLACISEQAVGNTVTTIDTIFHCMTGSPSKRPTAKMSARIRSSLLKLMGTSIHYDASEVCKKFGYNSKEPMIYSGSLLWLEMLDNIRINNSLTTCIHFVKRSPLFTLAEIKNGQILSYEKSLLDTPVNNTESFIPIKNYILRRINEIHLHKLKPIILFDTILKKNNFMHIDRLKKHRIKDYIVACFLHWQKHNIISSFQVVPKSKNRIYGFTFVIANFDNIKLLTQK